MVLDVLAMTTAIVSSPIEEILFVDEPFDYIRSIAKPDKKSGNYLLKINKANTPRCKVVYVFGEGAFYTFDVIKSDKTGYIVSLPRGVEVMPKPEDLVGLYVAMPKVYKAYRKPDLPEHCAIRLQELEIESMTRIIKDSTPEQLQRLFEFADDEDENKGGVKESGSEGDQPVSKDMAEAIDELKGSEDDLDKESLLEAMQLLNDNFELAKYTLNQITTTRQTVEAYFNMPIDLLKSMPTSVVDAINNALQVALERTKYEVTPTFMLDNGDESDGDQPGK